MTSSTDTLTTQGTAQGKGRLGLLALTALVVGSMIGGGVFSLPQNMASGASPGAILIAWAITGVGMLALALVYMRLSTRKPELDAGPYAYARAGFGDFMGFNSAWGYWLSAWLGNVSYGVLIFAALGAFFPMFGEGNTWQAVLGASIVLWLIHGLILGGVRQAAIVNVVTTFAKMIPLVVFIVVAVAVFDPALFGTDFWGTGADAAATAAGTEPMGLGSVITQVSGTMLVTLWVFIGIEGASVESGRAARRRDIGRATVIGFLIALVVYMAISLLSMGILSQPELAGLPEAASMADVLSYVVGGWGGDLVRLGLVVSVGGAFLSWTLFAAEIPFVAASEGMMPRLFSRENAKAAPMASLWITNLLVQFFLIVTLFSEATYMALFYIASTAILLPYVFSGAYAFKLTVTGEAYKAGEQRGMDMLIGIVATLYGCWLVYAAGLSYLLMVAILYAPGIVVYAVARRERGERIFTPWEMVLAIALVLVAAYAGWQMWTGAISPL
jgi:arginine:ornithine antiporter / lysine permease